MLKIQRCGTRESEISWSGWGLFARPATASGADRSDRKGDGLTLLHTNRFVCSDSQHLDRGEALQNFIMKRRPNNDKDRNVAQEFARHGSLRAGWRREPAG